MPTRLLERPRERLEQFPQVSSAIARVADPIRAHLARRRPDPEPIEFVPGVTLLRSVLLRPALLGLLASLAILFGASQPDSPFTVKNIAGAWYFGIPGPPPVQGVTPTPGQGLFLGVVAVYGGMLLMLRSWYDIVRITARYRGIPVRRLVPIFISWVLPLLIVAPLFSKDVYSYAAQGEMMAHAINPYHFGPGVLGAASPFSRFVDPLWANVPSPYGPVFLSIAGAIVSVSGHNVLMSIEGLRFLALLGTIGFAVAVPSIARSFNRDGAAAFTLAALNPLVLLHLVVGAHNDALMLGLLVPGYALARRGRPVLGIILCGLGAAVKVPALIGAIYIGWEWLGTGRPWRDRLRPVATALVIAVGVMAMLSEAAGLGWGWVAGLSNPDTVRSWLDPATGVGLLAGHVVSTIGLGNHGHVLLTLARGSGILLAIAVSLYLLIHSEQIGPLRALGWSLVAIVVLGPVIQPWYASWGFVFLAPVAVGGVRKLLVVISGIACYLGLPGGRVLINELGAANPGLVAVACGALVGVAVLMVYPKFRRTDDRLHERELATK